MSATNKDYFDFESLAPELRVEVIKHLDIQTLGRFIQINRSSESHISKDDWRRKIQEIDHTIWPQLSKRTRKGDSKLLCAIIREGSIRCNCATDYFPLQWLDLLLHLQKIFPSLPAQNAFLCLLLTYAKHGSVPFYSLSKNIGMKCGDVFVSHRRVTEFFLSNRGYRKTGFLHRLFLHQFARVTYSWSVRWKMAPLFINNREAFSEGYIKLYDQDSTPIEFNPVMRHRSIRQNRKCKTGPLKIDNAKTKFYSIEQIRKNKFKIMLDGEELTPNDLYYFFDYMRIDGNNPLCIRSSSVPKVISNWLLEKRERSALDSPSSNW